MNLIISDVSKKLLTNKKWRTAHTALLAISGGLDSMVMWDVISKTQTLAAHKKIEIIIVHFNHNVRAESQQEANMIKRLAEEKGLTYFIKTWEQPARRNFEAEARKARYQFFADVAKAVDTNLLLTAHHLDDHIETLMMRMVRGTSLKGFQGIQTDMMLPFINSNDEKVYLYLMRPLLDYAKEDLFFYAREHRVEYREDASNQQDIYFRNRIRLSLMPFLKKENPNVLTNMNRLVQQLQMSYQVHLADFWENALNWLSKNAKGEWEINVSYLNGLNPARRAIYLTIFCEEYFINDFPNLANETANILKAMVEKEQNANSTIQLGSGWYAVREYHKVTLSTALAVNDFEEPIELHQINAWYELKNQGKLGFFEANKVSEQMLGEADMTYAIAMEELSTTRLVVRHRQDGDRMLLGTKNKTFNKKISRILIDNKVSPSLRDDLWLLATEDEVLWIIPTITSPLLYPLEQTDTISHIFLFQYYHE